MLRIVQLVNGLRPSNKWNVRQQVFSSYCTNSHVHALLVNGHRLATNSYAHEWDFVVPCFLHQHGELSLASYIGNAGMSTSINFRLP